MSFAGKVFGPYWIVGAYETVVMLVIWPVLDILLFLVIWKVFIKPSRDAYNCGEGGFDMVSAFIW